MKIQCDVCNKETATVFCSADEAALCGDCDHKVHHANKLASKHRRFTLLHSTLQDTPLCDICQERRALTFCREDRAILCKECDVPLHQANDLTKKHHRFLLTGVKFSASCSIYQPESSSSPVVQNTTSDSRTEERANANPLPMESVDCSTQKTIPLPASQQHYQDVGNSSTFSTSSISQYFTEALPGWRVDDFLDPSPSPSGYCKTSDDIAELSTQEFGNLTTSSDSTTFPTFPLNDSQDFVRINTRELYVDQQLTKISRRRTDDGYMVPDINYTSRRNQLAFNGFNWNALI